MRMLLPFNPVTARPAMFGSIRGIVGTRDGILTLRERTALCAKAGELPHPTSNDKTASNDTITDRIFSGRNASTRIMGLWPYSPASPLMAPPRRD
jgi:hypothetical protein